MTEQIIHSLDGMPIDPDDVLRALMYKIHSTYAPSTAPKRLANRRRNRAIPRHRLPRRFTSRAGQTLMRASRLS